MRRWMERRCWSGFVFVLGLLLAAVLVACDSGGDDRASSTPPTPRQSPLPLPGEVSKVFTLVPAAYVEIDVWHEGEPNALKTIRVEVDPETNVVSSFTLTLPLGKQTVWIDEFIVDPVYGRVSIARTETHTIDVTGPATIDFSDTRLRLPLPDEDGDNVPNVIELVERTDPNNNLSYPLPPDGAVQLRSLAIAGSTLTPNFDPGRSYYHAAVAATVSEVHVTAQLNSGNATLRVNGEIVESGFTRVLAVPSMGQMRVTLNVTAGDKDAMYTVDINRHLITLEAKPWDGSADLTWDGPATATYNVYRYLGLACDLPNYTVCPDGAMFPKQTSPYTATDLVNGRVYSFKVEAIFPDGVKSYTEAVPVRPDRVVLDGGVNAIAVAGGGTAYVGGTFTRAMVMPTYGAAVDAVTGRPDADYPVINGPVHAVVGDGQGGWFIGGAFTRIGSVERLGLAHLLANNEVDANWSPVVGERSGTGSPPVVKALALEGKVLVVGGRFTRIGEAARRNLAVVSTTGTVLPWNESGADDEVNALAVSKGIVYVGGMFSNLADNPRSRVGAVSIADGRATAWRADAVSLTSSPSFVNALVVMGDTVYVGGGFAQLGGETRNGLAAVSTNGRVQPWSPALGGFDGSASAIAIQGDTAYVAGSFNSVGTTPRARLAAIGLDSAAPLRDWAPTVRRDFSWPFVRCLVATSNAIVIAGDFTFVTSGSRGESRNGAAAIGLNGEILPWNTPGVVSEGRALAVGGDKIFIGGNRIAFYEKPRLHLAAVSAEGNVLPWNPAVELTGNRSNDLVYDLEVVGDTVYVGGNFDRLAGEPRRNLAAITTDGRVTAFQPQVDGTVLTLTSNKNRLFVGGYFSTIDGSTRHRLAAFSGNDLDQGWAPMVQADGQSTQAAVSEIEILGDTVYVGGSFYSGGTNPQSNLVAIDAELGVLLARPTEWPPFSGVTAMAVTADKLFVVSNDSLGILLTALGLNSRTKLWDKRTGTEVRALQEWGGVLYTGFNGNDLHAVHAQTGNDLGWQLKLDGAVLALAAFDDTLYVGGNFQSVDGRLTGSLAMPPRFKLP